MTAHLHVARDSFGDRPVVDGAPIRVVLADDHTAARRSLRLLLDGESDVEVIAEAADLGAAVRHVCGQGPHVLVLDLEMPNGSSIQTIRTLRGSAPDTGVVVMTMEESPAFARQALAAGASAFVLKHQADIELPAAVRAAAHGERYVTPRLQAVLDGMGQAARDGHLSDRETEILRLIALGFTSAEIAVQLHLSRRTVETHRARIHHKLGLRTRAELVRFALRNHLIG